MTIPIDLIIDARWIIPVIPDNQIYTDCSIAVNNGKIVALAPTNEIHKRYQTAQHIQLNNHALTPGLINTHGHSAMTLLRGFADDYPLQEWLEQHIWPAEGRWVSEEFVRDGTELALAEMLQTGTTCFSDMYFYPEQTALAVQEAGMRAQITFPIFDFPCAWGTGPDDYLHKGLNLHDDYRAHELINIGFGPHAPYTVGDETLAKIGVLAQEMDTPIQIHLHETEFEVQQSIEQYGKRPSERLFELGLLSPLTQCVHMTQIDDTDLKILQDSGAHVLHCPSSNLKLASGFCPVERLQQAGINVAIGTDGAASNNDLDLLSELKLAALLAKAVHQDAAALNAHSALKMATLNGAKALGLHHHIGSLEVGKQADMAAFDLSGLAFQPLHNPVSQLVYTNTGNTTSHVWVNGKLLLNNGQLTTLNEQDIRRKAQQWHNKLVPQH